MPQDTRLATSGGLIGLPRAQHSVENGPCFGCMWWDNKSFRLRVYFYTQMPATLPGATQRPSSPRLPVSAGLCPEQRLHQAGGFQSLAQRRGGALGSAVDQGGHGTGDSVVPWHVGHEDTPRGGQDCAEPDTRIPLERDPLRHESDIPAEAGEGILRGRTGSRLERIPRACPQGICGGLGSAVGTAPGHRVTEYVHSQALRRAFRCSDAWEQRDEATETHQSNPPPPPCCLPHMSQAVRDDGSASALRCLSVGGGLLKGQYVLGDIFLYPSIEEVWTRLALLDYQEPPAIRSVMGLSVTPARAYRVWGT